ncbi:hypothetical protein N331_12701, partial [Merops nubicus]
AAINFLLLAHGHGYKEFVGMCCMNLSDHSVSIHKQIKQQQENMKRLSISDGGLSGWLDS